MKRFLWVCSRFIFNLVLVTMFVFCFIIAAWVLLAVLWLLLVDGFGWLYSEHPDATLLGGFVLTLTFALTWDDICQRKDNERD